MSGVSQSRFYMWRAVIAFAHADGVVVPEERELVENYCNALPFSDEQKAVLSQDLSEPQDIAGMFDKIDSPEDQGEFFQFARIMTWCDGDFDEQERLILEAVKDTQMARLNAGHLSSTVRETRKSAEVDRLAQDEAFKNEAKNKVGFGAVLRSLVHIGK